MQDYLRSGISDNGLPLSPELRDDLNIRLNVLMGAGSICIPGIVIGANSRIAAGIVVTTNVNANTTLLLRQNIIKM